MIYKNHTLMIAARVQEGLGVGPRIDNGKGTGMA